MRKSMLFILSLVLVSCNVTIDQKVERKYIYNSNGELIATPETVQAKGDLSAIDADYVAEYNSTHDDDQLRVLDEETPIDDQTPAKVTFAYSDTNEPWKVWPAIDRALVKGNRDGWALQLDIESMQAGRPCSLYIDKDPPPIQEPPPPNLWVALVNTTTGDIYYSEYWPTEAEAVDRYRAMQSQAEINNLRPENMGAGVWIAYIGPTEYGK